MSATSPFAAAPSLSARARAPDRAARRAVVRRLSGLRAGELVLQDGVGAVRLGRPSADGLRARVAVRDPRFWRRAALGGSLGAAEAYLDGHWSSDDPVALVRLLVREEATLEGLSRGAGRLREAPARLWHALRRNSRSGSRRNVRDHYDLGNDFFGLFLDETLTYSCGIFERPDASLREASEAKLERVCRKLALRPTDHVLEIGSGWGSFALHAARDHGCRVTTATVSRAQHALARERVRDAGLADRVEVLLRDYRRLEGRYDKLVSIEMIEAVGEAYYGAFFRSCAERLRPGGTFVLQAITTPDQRWERSRRSVDFLKRHVFPGGQLPSVGALLRAAARESDLRLVHLEEIGAHYVGMLRGWRERLLARADEARALGADERRLRLFDLYLATCEACFAERYVGDAQLVFARTGGPGAGAGTPPTPEPGGPNACGRA